MGLSPSPRRFSDRLQTVGTQRPDLRRPGRHAAVAEGRRGGGEEQNEMGKTTARPKSAASGFQPYVPDDAKLPEFTWSAVLVGAVLGIVFGASSLYLVLKVGMTVSASIPVAVLSITLFRGFSQVFGVRRATILENNIVQTTGSAGESIAFGVGVTMPALMLLGFDMDVLRVMTVGVLGGLLGILMMIPLRRAFIVKQHGTLTYPEGTACAEVLIVGEEGGHSAETVFAGFGLAFCYKLVMQGIAAVEGHAGQPLYNRERAGAAEGRDRRRAVARAAGRGLHHRPADRLDHGGRRRAGLRWCWSPLIAIVRPTESVADRADRRQADPRHDAERDPHELHPLHRRRGGGGGRHHQPAAGPAADPRLDAVGHCAIWPGRARRRGGAAGRSPRTERDLPIWLTLVGSLVPGRGDHGRAPAWAWAFSWFGLLWRLADRGLRLSVRDGFVAVDGEIGSSSNPISGMTVATLLFTCLIFVLAGHVDKAAILSALTVAAVVCIAASNGGTTSQDLKTGYLVGATPIWQQLAILVGALTSALVIGWTLLVLNDAGTVYSRLPVNLPRGRVADVGQLHEIGAPRRAICRRRQAVPRAARRRPGPAGRGAAGKIPGRRRWLFRYYVDPAINGRLKERDDDEPVTRSSRPPRRS